MYKLNNKKLYYIILFNLDWIRSIWKFKSKIRSNLSCLWKIRSRSIETFTVLFDFRFELDWFSGFDWIWIPYWTKCVLGWSTWWLCHNQPAVFFKAWTSLTLGSVWYEVIHLDYWQCLIKLSDPTIFPCLVEQLY